MIPMLPEYENEPYNDSMYELADVYLILSVFFNSLSLVCGLLVLVIMISLLVIDKELVNRLSLRFALGIGLVDFFRAINFLVYTYYNKPGFVCSLVAFNNYWFTLIYLFLTNAIAVNLHRVFVIGILFKPIWEYYYWPIALLGSLFISIIPLASGQFGFDEATATCDFIDTTSPSYKVWIWSTHIIWVSLSIMYCTYVVCHTIRVLNAKACKLHQGAHSHTPQSRHIQKIIRKLIFRVSYYCLIPVATQLFHVILRGYESFVPYQKQNSDIITGLSLLSLITTALPGVLNFLAFLIDPALLNACQTLKERKTSKKAECNKTNKLVDQIQLGLSTVTYNSDNANIRPGPMQHSSICNIDNSSRQGTSVTEDNIFFCKKNDSTNPDTAFQPNASINYNIRSLNDDEQNELADIENLTNNYSTTSIGLKKFIKGL